MTMAPPSPSACTRGTDNLPSPPRALDALHQCCPCVVGNRKLHSGCIPCVQPTRKLVCIAVSFSGLDPQFVGWCRWVYIFPSRHKVIGLTPASQSSTRGSTTTRLCCSDDCLQRKTPSHHAGSGMLMCVWVFCFALGLALQGASMHTRRQNKNSQFHWQRSSW